MTDKRTLHTRHADSRFAFCLRLTETVIAKSSLSLIAAVILWSHQYGLAQAVDLTNVSFSQQQGATTSVFPFHKSVQSEKPMNKKVEIKQSVKHRNVTGPLDSLPRKKTRKVRKTSSELADNKLSVAEPTLLTQQVPNRTLKPPIESSDNFITESAESLTPMENNTGKNMNYDATEDQASYQFPGLNYKLLIYISMLFNVFTLVIIGLLVTARLKKRPSIESENLERISASTKTSEATSTDVMNRLWKSDQRIANLDDRIQAEIDMITTNESVAGIDSLIRTELTSYGQLT